MKWFEREDGARLLRESEAVRAAYPHLSWEVRDERVWLEGALKLQSECGVEHCVQIRVEFPDNYPLSEPKAFDAADRFSHIANRHFYPDGRCCLWLPPLSGWKPDDPQALLHLLHQTAIFFEKQFIYDVIQRWPGKQWGHNEMGYLEWFCEKLEISLNILPNFLPVWRRESRWGASAPCPCGSGLKYRRCHRGRVEELDAMMNVKTFLEGLAQSLNRR